MYRDPEPERMTASIGASVDLPCRLPQNEEVSWNRDQGPLPASAQQVRTALRIEAVSEEEAGRYICSSRSGTHYVDLRVQRKFARRHFSD